MTFSKEVKGHDLGTKTARAITVHMGINMYHGYINGTIKNDAMFNTIIDKCANTKAPKDILRMIFPI